MKALSNYNTFPRLLGDIGGTNARFAWQEDADSQLSEISNYFTSQHESLLNAVKFYLSEHKKFLPRTMGIAIATQVLQDRVTMVNNRWSFSIAEFKNNINVHQTVFLNDFTALALSLPTLPTKDLFPIGFGKAVANAPIALLGPGSGLGVSGLLPAGLPNRWVPISGEGGHVTLSGENSLELAVIDLLKKRYGHASAERALSGPGLIAIYEALGQVNGKPLEQLTASEIMAHAKASSLPLCSLTLDMFFAFLGSTAGNLALTLGAIGGLFVGGGIVPRVIIELEKSSFRERFISKGRYRDYLNNIPTQVICSEISPALLGASIAVDNQYS